MRGTILLVYEDDKFAGLDKIIRRCRQHLARKVAPEALVPPEAGVPLEAVTVTGSGGFAKHIGKYVGQPLAKNQQAPDFVLCIADVDHPEGLVSGSQPIHTAQDLRNFRRAWRDHLRAQTSVRPDRVFAEPIRWSQESLWTSVPEMLLEYADRHGGRGKLSHFLSACKPDPSTAADRQFIDYRKPQDCLDDVVKAVEGKSAVFNKKHHGTKFASAVHDDHIATLLRRSPDIKRIARVLLCLGRRLA